MEAKVTVKSNGIEYEVQIGSKEYLQEQIADIIIQKIADEHGEEPDENFDPYGIEFEVSNWGDLEDLKELQDMDIWEDLINLDMEHEIINAGLVCGIALVDIEEAYQGHFHNDEEFTQELLESCGDLPRDLPLYIEIDWEGTARNIMQDYYEEKGYYFRIL